MFGDELLELSGELRVTPESELGLDSLLERCKPDLLEPLDGQLGEGFVGEVGERGSAPEPEGLAQEPGGEARIAPALPSTRLLSQPLEVVKVELLG